MRPSFRAALANALLLFVSIGVTWLVASFVIFRFLLPHLSLNLHPHFPDIAEVFAQTSKADTAPHDYIALLGDSYAEGQGDGLLAANGDRAKFVHSAHILHRLTGRDVVSLGLGGAGSVQAMVRQPARILLGDCFLYPRLEQPRQILVYFYEGNDLVDIMSERQTLLYRYLSPDFSQSLLARHGAVDSAIVRFADSLLSAYRAPTTAQLSALVAG